MKEFFINLIQIILNPQAGWEDLDTGQLRAWRHYKESHQPEPEADPHPGAAITDHHADDAPASYSAASAAIEAEAASHTGAATEPAETNFGRWLDSRMTHTMLTVVIPFFALCALTSLVRIAYGLSAGHAALMAAVEFVSLMMSLLVTRYALLYFLPGFVHPEAEATRGRSLTVAIMAVSVLATIIMIANLVKVHNTLISFVQLYPIAIIWKSTKYLDVLPWKELFYITIGSLFVLLTYYTCFALLNSVF